MWGSAIIGFGKYHYKYASGREGDWFRIGFAPRKNSLTIYLIDRVCNHNAALAQLGTNYRTGSSCLYLKNLDKVELKILRELFVKSYENMNASIN